MSAPATAVDTVDTRTPPHDLAAEQAVLGSMLLSKDALAEVLAILNADDYYRPVHATIHRAIIAVFAKGEPVDEITVTTHLINTRDIARVGGAPYIHTLVAGVPSPASGGYYARIVAEKATARRIIEAGVTLQQLGYTPDPDPETLRDRAAQVVYEAVNARSSDQRMKPLSALIQPALDTIEAAGQQDGLRGLSTGVVDVDRLLNGLRPGQLVIVAGRPGMGKTVFATDIARHTAIQHGLAASIFSLEMSHDEIMARVLAAECSVPLTTILSGKLEDADWVKVSRRVGEIADKPLFIDDTAATTLAAIRAKAQRLKQQHDLKLIVVDYLQLMTSPKRYENRQQEVSDLSRGLKMLAKDLELPIVAVSQLNRASEARAGKKPAMSDLRESGSLEQDSDIVILLHRDDYYDKESARAGEIDIDIQKNRNGPTDTITAAAQLHYSRIKDMAII